MLVARLGSECLKIIKSYKPIKDLQIPTLMKFKKSFGQLQQIKYSTNSQSNILDLSINALLKKQ